jgi:signal transduction histidine kinase
MLMLTRCIRGVLLCAFFSGAFLLTTAQPAFASTYGSGKYGTCTYSRDCPAVPPAVPDTPQTPPQANRDIIIIVPNLAPDGVIDTQHTTLLVQVQQKQPDGSYKNIDPKDVGWVVFYVNNQKVSTQYTPNADGQFSFDWDLSRYPGTVIDFVAYDKQGNIIQRKRIIVKISARIAALAQQAAQPPAIKKRELSTPLLYAIRTFPYWLLLILLAMAVRLWWQAIREARAISQLKKWIGREQQVAQLKHNFLGLVSHYLRTPLTLIEGGISLITDQGRAAAPGPVAQIQQAAGSLKNVVEHLIENAEKQPGLATIPEPQRVVIAKATYKSPLFWAPVVIIVLLIGIVQVLAAYATTINYNVYDILTEIIVGSAIACFFLLGMRQHQLKQADRAYQQAVLDYEEALDVSRNAFVSESASALAGPLKAIGDAAAQVQLGEPSTIIQGGIAKFDKLVLQLQIAAAASRQATIEDNTEAVGIGELAAADEQTVNDQVIAKKLSFTPPAHDIQVFTNRLLFNYVIKTMVQNAVKFAENGSSISVQAAAEGDTVHASIQDTGVPVNQETVTTLFEPFTRGTSLDQFDFEGVGLNLYISRILMARLGGTIQLSGTPGGATASITIPKFPA